MSYFRNRELYRDRIAKMPPRNMSGGAIYSRLKSGLTTGIKALHDLGKREKFISRALKSRGYNKLGTAAEALGYGRRRRRRVRRA